jgi:hypothetical protein
VLEKNRACLGLFDEAMQQPYLLVPQLKGPDDDVSYLGGWRRLALLKCIQIIWLHRAKNDKEAFDGAFEIINFGERVENCGGPIIHYFTGSGIKTIGTWRIQKMTADILYAMFAPSAKSFTRRKCSEDVNVTATQLLLALKIYKMQHGRLPDSLSELVPEFFPQVPLDDFDGKPFRYLPEKKIIYSVGPYLQDLGGKERKDYSSDYNLPFKIEF